MLRRTSDPKMKTLAYERLLSELGKPRLSESTRCRLPELELQAKIFSGEFGVSWRGEDGESIEILHFGVWNREPGPDFSGAQMLINRKKISGDIEIERVDGSVKIQQDSSGGIRVEDVKGSVNVDSDSSGDIYAANVKVDFTVSEDSSGSIDHESIGGKVTVPSNKRDDDDEAVEK